MNDLNQNILINSEKDSKNQDDFVLSWNRFRESLKTRCSVTAYGNWLSPIEPKIEDGKPVLYVPNIFVQEYLYSNYKSDLLSMNENFDFFNNPNSKGEKVVIKLMTPRSRERNDENIVKFSTQEEFNFNFFSKEIVPKRYSPPLFDKCNLIKENVLNLAKEWVENPKSILIHGNLGIGKTQLSWSMIGEAIKKGKISSNYKIFDGRGLDSFMLKAIKSDYGDYDEIQKICKCEFLFIDDIGRETNSERFKNQIFEIINYRYSHLIPTFMTSNLNLDELSNRLGEAVVSRMQEWMIFDMTGDDLRKG